MVPLSARAFLRRRAGKTTRPRERLADMTQANPPPLVAVIMGSKTDWETMRHADEMLTRFGVPHECRIVSAHRTPA